MTDEDPYNELPIREILAAMVRMEGVLDPAEGGTNRLLGFLLEMDDDPLDRLVL
jgi:hypothetical protein